MTIINCLAMLTYHNWLFITYIYYKLLKLPQPSTGLLFTNTQNWHCQGICYLIDLRSSYSDTLRFLSGSATKDNLRISNIVHALIAQRGEH